MKYYIITIFILTSCSWTTDQGWKFHANRKSDHERTYHSGFKCTQENEFGKFMEGGGCNAFGCWIEGGGCNEFGCSVDGKCTAASCEKKIDSVKCLDEA